MTPRLRHSLGAFCICSLLSLPLSAQDTLVKSFQNAVLMDGKVGKEVLLSEADGNQLVLVKWKRGYVAYGLLHEQKPEGYWYLYDGSGRLRKRVFFSAGVVAMAEVMDRNGNVVSKTNFTLPW